MSVKEGVFCSQGRSDICACPFLALQAICPLYTLASLSVKQHLAAQRSAKDAVIVMLGHTCLFNLESFSTTRSKKWDSV